MTLGGGNQATRRSAEQQSPCAPSPGRTACPNITAPSAAAVQTSPPTPRVCLMLQLPQSMTKGGREGARTKGRQVQEEEEEPAPKQQRRSKAASRQVVQVTGGKGGGRGNVTLRGGPQAPQTTTQPPQRQAVGGQVHCDTPPMTKGQGHSPAASNQSCCPVRFGRRAAG